MKYVKLHEQFIFELADLSSGYQFREVNIRRLKSSNYVVRATYDFSTKVGTEYEVMLEFAANVNWPIETDYVYEIVFFPKKGDTFRLTEEGDALRILITVASIIAHIVNTYHEDTKNIPIVAKGTHKSKVGDEIRTKIDFHNQIESKNDRINKFLAKKILNSINSEYSFKDLGTKGFALIPPEINQDPL